MPSSVTPRGYRFSREGELLEDFEPGAYHDENYVDLHAGSEHAIVFIASSGDWAAGQGGVSIVEAVPGMPESCRLDQTWSDPELFGEPSLLSARRDSQGQLVVFVRNRLAGGHWVHALRVR